jgi:hypothetical protein
LDKPVCNRSIHLNSNVAQPLSFVLLPADNAFMEFVDSRWVSGATHDTLFRIKTFASTSMVEFWDSLEHSVREIYLILSQDGILTRDVLQNTQ